jgi:ribose/xylose/arabinose/galactoside ABC-type transport system permease subunit
MTSNDVRTTMPKGSFFRHLIVSEYFVLLLTALLFMVLLPVIPRIASLQNLANVASNVWPLLAIAVGQTLILITAGIDLSQIAVIGLTSTIGGILMTSAANPVLFEKSPLWGSLLTEQGGPLSGHPAAVPVSLLCMLLVGALIGLINGLIIAKVKIPAFMMTLVSLLFFSSFAVYLTRAENISNLPNGFLMLGRGNFLGFPLVISLGLTVLVSLLLQRTVFGRWLYAVGRNPKAAEISGVPITRVLVVTYMLSSVCATIGGILYSARLGLGRPGFGQGFDLLLDVIGATVIGGTSLFGGHGKILWTVFGVLLFVLLSNALNLLNLSYFTVNMVKGTFILGAALLDVARRRYMAVSA